MSRLNVRWLIPAVLLLLVPTVSSAQQASPWSFEASIIYNQQSYGFDDVHEAIDSRIALEQESPQDRTVDNRRTITEEWSPDLRAGFRYNSFYVGFLYSGIPEQTVGYESYALYNGNRWASNEFVVTTSAREYMISAGYILPLGSRLSLGLLGSMGWGFAEGTYKDPHPPYVPGQTPNGDPGDAAVNISGNYTPWRVEGRVRVALTQFVDLDLGGGWRSSRADSMVGEYGLLADNYPVAVFSTSDPKIAEFDWSGSFFGVGLTLKNPFGD